MLGRLTWIRGRLLLRSLSVPTVKRLKGGFGPNVSDEARIKMQNTLERAGISFIDENGGGPGVRLRNRQRPKQPK
jgi:hypothetical protein